MLALVAVAFALPDPPDMEVLAARAQTAFVELPGCHSYALDVRQTNTAGVPGSTSLHVSAEGTLAAGTWSPLTWRLEERTNTRVNVGTDVPGGGYPFVVPLFGSFGGDKDSLVNGNRNLLLQMLEAVKSTSEGDWVSTEAYEGHELYRLERSLKQTKAWFRTREDRVQVLFEPGTVQPRVWRTVVEHPIQRKGLRISRLEVLLTLAADGTLQSEDLAMRGDVGVLHLEVQRHVDYRVTGVCAPP